MPESLIFLTENSPSVSNDRFWFKQLLRGTPECKMQIRAERVPED